MNFSWNQVSKIPSVWFQDRVMYLDPFSFLSGIRNNVGCAEFILFVFILASSALRNILESLKFIYSLIKYE